MCIVAANLLEDIVPVPEDAVMSDAQAQPHGEDNPLPSEMPLIIARDPNADEDDRTTQNISEPAEISTPDDIKDEAVSGPLPMHAVPTADGAVFMMEDVPHRVSLGGAQSDISMHAASEKEQDDVQQVWHETADKLHYNQPQEAEADDQPAGNEDAASNEAEDGGRSEVEDLDVNQFRDADKASQPDDDDFQSPRGDFSGFEEV